MAGTHDQPTEKRQKRGKRVLLLVIGLMLVAGLVCNYWPVKGHITISRETTYITGPLNEDGTVNYVAALNERMSKGVTPENNAAPLLIRVWGAEIIDEPVRARVFEILKMEPVPEEGLGGADLEDVVEDMWPKGAPKGAATRPSRDDVEEHSERVLKRAMEGPWSADELPAAAVWLKENEKLLAAVAEAAKRPRLYMPLVGDLDDRIMLAVGTYRPRIADVQMYVARAMNKLGGGDVAGAWADVLTALRLGRLLGQRCELLHVNLSHWMEETACEAAAVIATSGRLTVRQGRAFQAELDALPPPTDIAGALLYERFTWLEVVTFLSRRPDLARAMEGIDTAERATRDAPTSEINWDYTLRTFNDLWDTITEAETNPEAKVRDQARRRLEEILARAGRWRRKPWFGVVVSRLGGHALKNLRTRVVTDVMMFLQVNFITGIGSKARKAEARLQLVKLALGLAAFRAEKGVYPQKLSELSPAYVKKVPVDIFADGPLVYKRADKGYLLYSVGENMKDDGGVEDDEWPADKDDIAVRVK